MSISEAGWALRIFHTWQAFLFLNPPRETYLVILPNFFKNYFVSVQKKKLIQCNSMYMHVNINSATWIAKKLERNLWGSVQFRYTTTLVGQRQDCVKFDVCNTVHRHTCLLSLNSREVYSRRSISVSLNLSAFITSIANGGEFSLKKRKR